MLQVGWASASSTVTSCELVPAAPAERAARGGQDERVDRARLRGPRGTGRAAECSESTGSSRPPPRSLAASASSPAATRLSLFASASVTPRSSAQSVAPTPAKPTTAFRTTSGSARFQQLGDVAADLHVLDAVLARQLRQVGRAGCERARARARGSARRPRSPAGRSSRWRRAARSASRAQCALRQGYDHVERRHGGEEQRVDPVEHAAVAAEQPARVLHLQVALERRLEEVAGGARERDRGAEGERLGDREEVLLVEREERDRDRSERAGDEPLPRLAGRERRARACGGRAGARRSTRPCRRRRRPAGR